MPSMRSHIWSHRAVPVIAAGIGIAVFWAGGISAAHAAIPDVGLGLDRGLDVGLGGAGWELGRRLFELDASAALCLSEVKAQLLQLHPHEGTADGAACSSVAGIGYALLALVAVVVVALGRMRLKTEQKRLEYAQKLVEQGMEPPAGLLMGPARGDLRKGIVLLFAGAGLFVSGLFLGDRGLAAGGLVPEFVGIGYLVSFWLASREPGGGQR